MALTVFVIRKGLIPVFCGLQHKATQIANYTSREPQSTEERPSILPSTGGPLFSHKATICKSITKEASLWGLSKCNQMYPIVPTLPLSDN